MNNEIQSILNEIGLRRSALSEFITALLPILQRKIDHIMPDLLKNGSLLSHFMHENLVFDSYLREAYLYLPSGQEKWDGLIQHSLKSPRVFATWRDTEKDCTSLVYC
jgi:RAD50-interacting protein 1